MLIPNRDSHNGYPTVRSAELQSITLSHQVDIHETLTTHKLACSCFVTLFGHQYYQPVFYAAHDQHFPSESEERAASWVGFGEHCGDAMTHKHLDKITQKIIYRSAVRPLTKSNPNYRLTEVGGEASTSKQPSSKVPTVFIRSRQDDADPSHMRHMPEFDPDDLTGRTFLLPPQENGERLRAKVTKKVFEQIEAEDANRIPNINFILDIGEGKVEEFITYNQLLDHLEQAEEEDNFMD